MTTPTQSPAPDAPDDAAIAAFVASIGSDCTADTPVQVWLDALDAIIKPSTAEEDVIQRLLLAGGATRKTAALNDCHPEYLVDQFREIASVFPALPVRSALGWIAVTLAADGPPPAAVRAWLWEKWRPGLATDGWLFAAAGVSATEAMALLDSGQAPDTETLRAMAALRGVAVLVT